MTQGSSKVTPSENLSSNNLPTPIKVNILAKLLSNYEDKDFIIDGLYNGFDLGYVGEQLSQSCNNNLTVNSNLEVAWDKVMSEVALNRIEGPFPEPPLPFVKCSPLALREKSTPGQFRLLHNLSYPHDNTAVNANIPRELASTSYSTINDATDIIKNMTSPYLAKVDVAEAFRILCLKPECYNLTGFKLKGSYFFDKCLCMGASSSCLTFQRFANSLLHILKHHYQITKVVNVLDDFLLIGDSEKSCQLALDSLKSLAELINLPLAPRKTVGPTQCLTFLGIQIDTVKRQLSIPPEKISKYSSHILVVLRKEQATLKELQSLTGKLQFVSIIVPVGRAFLRRLYDLTIGKNKHSIIKLSEGALADLLLWLTFLKDYNAKEFYNDRIKFSSVHDHIYSDSSNTGYGATFGNEYFYGEFPDSWQHFDIQVKEFYPILLLITIKAKSLSNSHLTIRTDNMSVATAINSQTSKNKKLMHLLRKFVLTLLKNNIKCTAYHIQGKKNSITDALSRMKINKALSLLQQLGYTPALMPVPSSLRPANWKLF